MHNSAHLSPLAVSYFCNGTGYFSFTHLKLILITFYTEGRDTYISKDGGGLYNPPNKTT